jgi:PAS domain S-box-containing protein
LKRLHEANERLLAKERRYHLWLDQLPAGVWLREAGGRLAFANRAAGETVGIDAAALVGRESRLGADWWFCDEEGREMDVERDLLEVVARTGRERRGVIVGIKAPAAEETRWLLVNSQPWEGGVLSTSIDVTDRKRAEEALQVSEEQLRQALEVGEIGVFDHNYETGKVFWSGRLQTLFQTGEGDVLGLELTLERMHPEDRPWVEAEIRKAQEPGENGRIELEHRLLRPDGTIRWVRVRARFSFEGEGQARRLTRTVGACVDVTSAHVAMEERERFRAESARAQRLEAVGRLAGGVAHEFNNLLTVILGYAERLGRCLPAGAEQQVWAGEIGKAGRRAAKLAAQLLAFGRRQMMRRTWVDVNLVVLEAVRILDEMAGGMVRWEAQLDPRLEQIRVDHDQLFEIVMSLGMNAREAVDGQGRVELGTAMSEIGAKDAEGHAERRAGRYVVLTVRDLGRGMGAEELERIFEPFYTTKAAGSGTGLSLPSAYGAARQNGGWVEVESQPGRGSTFRVYLPAGEEEGGGRV